MAEEKKQAPAGGGEPPRAERPELVMPPQWGPNMMIYGDVSRMLFRLHRNVAVHMEAHKRLAERLQAVFSHEQALVLELARLIDESMSLASRKSNEDKPPPGPESLERIFAHAENAMKETGRMLTDIQTEALGLLQHYIEEAGADRAAPRPEENKKPDGSG